MAMIKASGALVWGASDILQVLMSPPFPLITSETCTCSLLPFVWPLTCGGHRPARMCVGVPLGEPQVRFSNLPSMHSLGDSATTLGLLFAAVGFGCFIGPLFSNRLTPPRLARTA